ncbi:hypothetical protein POUND7_001839, partial [Theobroma cacao]
FKDGGYHEGVNNGRLGYDENGRLEIICNAKGVLFIEAETTSIMDDLVKEFKDDSEGPQLVPKIDYSGRISSYPVLGLQVTTFKCGGISLGVSTQHTLVDGSSGLHFINSWANTVRGCSPNIAPFLDRTLLRARHPPTPKFRHIEFEPSPSLQIMISTSKSQLCPKPSIVSVFTITTDKLNALKVKQPKQELLEAQQLKLNMPVDGRNRLHPPLPPGYIGNVIFMAALVALAGELLSKSFIDTVKRIHKILKEMDDEYLRSAIDYIEKAHDVEAIRRGPQTMRCSNLVINSWISLPIHEADFRWGRPIFMRLANIAHEGIVYILPSPTKDGSLTLVTCLETSHIKLFAVGSIHVNELLGFSLPGLGSETAEGIKTHGISFLFISIPICKQK